MEVAKTTTQNGFPTSPERSLIVVVHFTEKRPHYLTDSEWEEIRSEKAALLEALDPYSRSSSYEAITELIKGPIVGDINSPHYWVRRVFDRYMLLSFNRHLVKSQTERWFDMNI